MRRAARVDATQAEIVAALRSIGAKVWIVGLPVDLLVGYAGRTLLIECKCLTGKREPKPTKHTALQKAFMLDWRGGPVATVTDAEGAINAVMAMASADEIERLRRALHEIAEEWAGAECGEPVYAQEAYAIGLAKRMYQLAIEAQR